MWTGIIIGIVIAVIYKIFFTTNSNTNNLVSENNRVDFYKYINSENEKSLSELNQIYNYFPQGFNSENRPFWMSDEDLKPFIVNAMICYSFDIEINNISSLIKQGNKFLKEVSEGTDYWNHIKKFSKKDFPNKIINGLSTDLKEHLISLNFIDRIILVEFLTIISSYEQNPAVSLKIHREIIIMDIERKMKKNLRLDETEPKYSILDKSTPLFELLNPIFELEDSFDYAVLPDIISKGEMREYAEDLGYELKKSWNAERVVNSMSKTEKGKDDLLILLKQLDTKIIINNSKYNTEISKQRNELNRLFELLCNI